MRGLLLLVFSTFCAACGGQQAVVTSSPPVADAGPTPASLVTTPCVLHAGSARGHRDSSGRTGGSCSFGAECFREPGHTAPGDGFVGLTCDETSCSCEWTAAADGGTLRAAFSVAAACADAETSQRLFMEHCMVGLTLYRDDAGAM
jgi:hypothetical protein